MRAILGREIFVPEFIREARDPENRLPDSNREVERLPDPVGTLEACGELVADGFEVLCYSSDDPIMAVRIRDAGFDAVELHVGHGYLLSQFLSPLINRRRDDYGGDLEARLRFPLRALRAVREGGGEGLCVLAKTNLSDGVPGGLELDESVAAARALVAAGAHGVIPSGGLVQRSAFYLMRGGVPIRQMAAGESSAMQRLAMRAFAPFLVKAFPYEPAFFFDAASQVLDAVDAPVGLLGGVDSAAAIARAMARGFDFVVMGRALLADPDFVARLAAGEDVVSRCTHCNECVAAMDQGGVRCVLP